MITQKAVISTKLVIPSLQGVWRLGMNIETIADIIGDNIEQVLDTYAHILNRFKDDELDKLHNYYKNNNIIY